MSISNYHRKFILLLFAILLPVILMGQFYFGRNKIQYERFDWQVIGTSHFNIYYYPEEIKIAQAAAYFAEEDFNYLEQKFNHTIDAKIPLFIYSNPIHFQQTNILPYRIPEGVGGFFEFIKRRVVIPYPGNMHDFQHVIRHELVHVFMFSKIKSVASDIGYWETPMFPLWFIEGLAEFWSQGWDSQGELIIRDAVLHDYLLPLESFELLQAGFLLYKEGQSFLRYYERNYGSDRIRMLLETYWQYDSFEDALSTISDKSYFDLCSEWKLSLKKEFAEALSKEKILKPGEFQVTEIGTNISPAIYSSKNGEQFIIYLTNRYGYTDIYQKKLREQKSTIVIKGERKSDFESLHFLQSSISVNQKGILAFVAKSGQQDALWLVNLKNHRVITSLHNPQLMTIRSPDWSPDGNFIVFSAQDFSGQSDLYIWDISKEQAIRLTNDLYSDNEPCFSPSSNYIVFSSDRCRPETDSGTDLFILDLSNGEIIQITKDSFRNSKPFWTRSQPRMIYYLSDRTGTQNVWALELPELSNSSNSKVNIYQVTNYHTGFYDIYPMAVDSLLVSAFQKYNYQIHCLPMVKDSGLKLIESLDDIVSESSWEIPVPGVDIRRKSHLYKMKYSLDFAQTAVAYDPIFGFLGGAQLGISDLLGNRYYHFLLANTARTRSEIMDRFNVAVTMVDLTHRSNHALGVFHFANDYFSPYEGFYFERAFGVRGALNYPIDVFRRLEFSISLWQSSKDYYFEELNRIFLVSNYFSLVHDNSLWCITGPIDGWRLRLTVGPTFDFKHSQIHNYTGLLDFRYYYRFHRHFTFAQATRICLNDGIDIFRYYIGGSWGLRGYNMYEIYGRKYVLLNQELRFPFAQSLILRIGSYRIGLAPIRGAAFIDVGNAWDYEFPGMIGSFGIGLRGVLLGGFVLRLDIGNKTDFRSLNKDLFFQFFFGWDY